MKNRLVTLLPFMILPIFTPVYIILDKILLVDIFGCGCVPGTQTNMLNIPFNANDLRLTVYLVLTVIMAGLGVYLSNAFKQKFLKFFYCGAILLFNIMITIYMVKTFMWA